MYKKLICIFLLALLTSCSTYAPQKGEILAGAAAGLDILSTQYALENGRVEANPIYKDETAVLTSAVLTIAIHAMLHKALKKFPEEIQIKYWGPITLIRGSAAAWNIYKTLEDRE